MLLIKVFILTKWNNITAAYFKIQDKNVYTQKYLHLNLFIVIPTCITALKKHVLPRLLMPLTGTKVLLMTGLLPLGGSV